jgi:decaprenylphospho-beta-D-ribofuranose 2-oxidase
MGGFDRFKTGQLVKLQSYGGVRESEAKLARPKSVDQLIESFARATVEGRKIALRGAGMAFDDQSMGDDIVLSLERFGGITVDPQAKTVTVGPAEVWGDITRECLNHDLWPAVVVSTSFVSAGGTLSANSYSRFVQTYGKESAWIERFMLVTPSGEVLACSRRENADLFRATIGGHGGIGAVTKITYRLVALNGARQARTEVHKTHSYAELIRYMTETPVPPGEAAAAIVVPRSERGFLLQSRYVAGQRLDPVPGMMHSTSVWRVPMDLAGRSTWVSRLVWRLAHERLLKEAHTYVDDLFGFTFFMDPNSSAKHFGRSLGFALGLSQQSHLVPPESAVEFLRAAQRSMATHRLQSILQDLLFVPEDPDCLLSSSHGLRGFLINVAFEKSRSSVLGRIELCFRELGKLCADMGGRVTLSKNVHVAAEDLEQMYGPQLDAYFALKRRVDPSGILSTRFLERLFPERMRGTRN